MGNTMKATDLHRIITEASNFAGTDKTIPSINVVRLEFNSDHVIAAATDRFTLGVSRADYTGETFTVNITLDDVKKLASIAKTAKRDTNWRDAELEAQFRNGDEVTAVTFRFNSGEALTVSAFDGEFPKYQQLIPFEVTSEPTLGYDASKLAQFAKVQNHHQMKVFPQGNKPTVVMIGEDFIGLIMPVRIGEDDREYTRPAWLA